MNNSDKYICEILKLARKAERKGEIPVGAIVVFNNKIVGRGYNSKMNKHDVTGHAEIVAIKQAARKLGDWRLDSCSLYVTLEPCNMCKTVIESSRIRNVYYLIESKFNNSKSTTYSLLNSNLSDEYLSSFQHFFKNNCVR